MKKTLGMKKKVNTAHALRIQHEPGSSCQE